MTAKDAFRATLVVLGTLAGAYILLLNIQIIIVLLFAIVIASAVRPIIMRLKALHVPEGLAVLLVYGGIALAIIILLALVLPPVISQLSGYLQNEDRLALRILRVQDWLQEAIFNLTGTTVTLADPEALRAAIDDIVRDVNRTLPNLVGSLGGIIGSAILVVVMGLYWLGSYQKAIEFLSSLFRLRDRENVEGIILKIEGMMGSYVRGLVLVALVVGILNFIILTIFRVPNAVTLAFIIGATTILPVIGGFLGGGLATFLALLTSPLNGVITFASFVAVQQIETHVLTPRTMARSIGVDPLLIIIGVFFGFTLYGVTGAILSIPILGTAYLLVKFLIIDPRVAAVQAYKTEGKAILIDAEPIPVAVVETDTAPGVPTTVTTPSGIILPGSK
jgi:predicted PurR-regulated permease PerM